MDCQSHLTGIVKELGLMRVQLVSVLWGIKTDIFASHHLIYAQGKPHVVKQL